MTAVTAVLVVRCGSVEWGANGHTAVLLLLGFVAVIWCLWHPAVLLP